MSEKIAVIGGGAWGTTLAALLADKGHEVSLWVYENDLALRMQKSRINDLYLPGHVLPKMEINVRFSHSRQGQVDNTHRDAFACRAHGA